MRRWIDVLEEVWYASINPAQTPRNPVRRAAGPRPCRYLEGSTRSAMSAPVILGYRRLDSARDTLETLVMVIVLCGMMAEGAASCPGARSLI